MKKTLLLLLLGTSCLAANGPIIKPSTGGGKPGGSSGQMQYNNGGAFAGTSGFTFDGTNASLNGTLNLTGNTSGYLLMSNGKSVASNTNGWYINQGNNKLSLGTLGAIFTIEVRINGRGGSVGSFFQNVDNGSDAESEWYSDTGKNIRIGVGASALGGPYQDNGYLIATNDILMTPGTSNKINVNAGDLAVTTAGKGLQIKEGSNARSGTATLASGVAWVPNTSVDANSRILLTVQTKSGTSTGVGVTSVTVNTGFNIFGGATDNSTVGYFIFEGL